MSTTPATDPSSISVSESAARRIAEILADEPTATMMRISVEGGGCSGFQYKFDLVGQAEPDDLLIEKGNAKVLIDSVSVPYMSGAIIDYVDELIGSAFKIRNPQATASCGCGTSFAV